MIIYVRKILNHDITHQISITQEVLKDFFAVDSNGKASWMTGKKSGFRGEVTFLLSTDPRFGGDIRLIINAEGGMSQGDFVIFEKTSDEYIVSVVKPQDVIFPFFNQMLPGTQRHLVVHSDDNKNNNQKNTGAGNLSPIKGGLNKIYYGAPGCGKSRHIADMLDEVAVEKDNIFRVTFHPEYANCDFIGQIMPKINRGETPEDDVVTYQFNPGPFTLALQRAYNTNDMVFLIIEEINRGNAAAIFGDMFQLLDRIKDSGDQYYTASEYPIKNPHMEEYLKEKVSDETILEKLTYEGVYIPSNLTIYATMNTSDQNVFTLDTAFKRRWGSEQIKNDIEKDTEHPYKNWFIPGTDVTWEKFVVKVNNKILDNKIQNSTNEDKRIGKYFVSKDCLAEAPNDTTEKDAAMSFAYKVLEYIWNDVCKMGRDDWFDPTKYRTLEDVIDAFVEEGLYLDVFGDNIVFKDED